MEYKSCEYDEELQALTSCKLSSIKTYDSIIQLEISSASDYCDIECESQISKSSICIDCELQHYNNIPSALRSKCNMKTDQGTQTMSIGSRFYFELSKEYDFFSLREDFDNTVIDVQQSFAPASFIVLMLRSCWWWISYQILLKDHEISIDVRNGTNLMYFSHLTNITLILTLIYQTLTTILSAISILCCKRNLVLYQPTKLSQRPNILICVTWVMYSTALVSEFVVSIGYWLFEYGGPSSVPGVQRGTNLYKHLIIGFLVFIDGAWIGRIPFRVKHLTNVVAYGIFYIAYSVLFSYCELGTRDGEIYRFIDWHDDPKDAALHSIFLGLVAAPMVFAIFWLESAFSWCCDTNGTKRRCTSL